MLKHSTRQEKEKPFLLRIQTPRNSSLGTTFKYLLESKDWTPKEGKTKASLAITAFYLAEAQRVTNPEQARATAIQAIYQLESQIRKIRHEFGLTDSNLPTDIDIAPTGAVRTLQVPTPPPTPQPVDIYGVEEMRDVFESIFE